MTRRLLIIFTGVILLQVVLFRNSLSPNLSNQIIIEGLRCTCPDAKVINGLAHLKSITPDSLNKYNLDYDEIYFENEISNSSDPMGVNQYIIRGSIIGKKSISKGDGHYYPLFKIDAFEDASLNNGFKWFIRGLLLFEIFIFIVMIKRKNQMHNTI